MAVHPIVAGAILLASLLAQSDASVDITNTLTTVTRQMMLQQLFVEERLRSDGHSGLKQARVTTGGTRPYFSETHSSMSRTASVHDHADRERTVGVGELIAVLNGIEFRTRHNDYLLVQPSTTSGDYHTTQDITYPGVPTSVTDQTSVDNATAEMREWFKAWRDQDYSVRDYRPYFKPVLCYLEGAWTTAEDLEESYESDGHSLDATSWFDLEEKIRFTSYAGSKDRKENYAYLPRTIMEMINGTEPSFAQWNYRILCNPLNDDLPLNRFRVVDEITTRMRNGWTIDDLGKSRAARFTLNPRDNDEFKDVSENHGLLDDLMEQIPGKDNYQAVLYDDAFDVETYHYEDGNLRLNAGYYHRWLQAKVADAMGTTTRHRGFADENLFMALTTHSEIAGLTLDECADDPGNPCERTQKWSYAIPLEIIYLTPLNTWNPYDINDAGGDAVTADGRNGGTTSTTAFNGVNSQNYYLTPTSFFTDGTVDADLADTALTSVGVLDQQGSVQMTSASGIRVMLPDIPDVGVLRTRYPIFSIFAEGSGVFKELAALGDIILRPLTNAYMFTENPTLASGGDSSSSTVAVNFKLKASNAEFGSHEHELSITTSEQETLAGGGEVTGKLTTVSNGHAHTLTLIYDSATDTYLYSLCDNQALCGDGHAATLRTL